MSGPVFHAVSSVSFEELMIPLEIRISVVNGREYVMYYHLTEQKNQSAAPGVYR